MTEPEDFITVEEFEALQEELEELREHAALLSERAAQLTLLVEYLTRQSELAEELVKDQRADLEDKGIQIQALQNVRSAQNRQIGALKKLLGIYETRIMEGPLLGGRGSKH